MTSLIENILSKFRTLDAIIAAQRQLENQSTIVGGVAVGGSDENRKKLQAELDAHPSEVMIKVRKIIEKSR